MANMVEALCQCGKRVEVATRRAEAKADNVWNHRDENMPEFHRRNDGKAKYRNKVFHSSNKLVNRTLVVVPLDQLRTVNPSANSWNPSEKYIQIVTRDGHEFWFMGFISYDKALRNLN
ncbi:unnamed protein product [Malus baccata var. baccata]